MAAALHSTHLIDRLPKARGRLTADAPLSQVTWFRVGGPAEVMFRPADIDDLSAFLAAKPADVPVTVLGVASNLLVRDGGIKGVVIRLGRGFVEIETKDNTVIAGGGTLDFNVALTARDAGIAGLEFLSGIPGTVGGGLRMNAGAYGSEFKDVLESAIALDAEGNRHELSVADLHMTYRHSGVPADWIFVAARFKGSAGDKLDIARRMTEIQEAREQSQPIRAKTGGSTFANPPGHKAWQLVDQAGCRGIRRGGAMISDKHANFLINTGAATAADIEGLGEEVRARVLAKTGITLEWEIKRVGVPTGGAA
ncbi:MAG TPA: UDP-N-acetylmuramate dehydrogenase [Stellaceae bacterium]|nr:UDP-N-acetylmuramate dehydrogenase [Stellaceae bacterium]